MEQDDGTAGTVRVGDTIGGPGWDEAADSGGTDEPARLASSPDSGTWPSAQLPRCTAPTVAGWQVEELLGAGGQGEVWLVCDDAGQRAALKLASEPGTGVDVERQALHGQVHPHVVPLLGTVETDRGTGLLSRHLPGGTLSALIQARGPLGVGETVSVLGPLATALCSLHESSVVHGDVSPANVLFDLDGSPWLTDLGAASVLGGDSRLGGTPGFSAPEVHEALDAGAEQPRTGSAADVYALAAVGWFCFTGRAPGPNLHRAPLPVLVPDVPVELALALESALDAQPEARPSAAELAAAVYATAECEPIRLHGAVTPETELLLPTLPPAQARDGDAGRPDRRGRRGRARAGTAQPRATRGRRRRWVWVAAVGLAVVSVLGILWGPGRSLTTRADAEPVQERTSPGGQAGHASSPAATASASAPAARSDTPSEVPMSAPSAAEASGPTAEQLSTIGVRRARALTHPDQEWLGDYAAPDSPAWRADRELVERMRTRGERFDGVSISVERTGPDRVEGPERVRVPVHVSTSAHDLVSDADRRVIARYSDTGPVPAEMELVRQADGWRLVELHAVSGETATPAESAASVPDA